MSSQPSTSTACPPDADTATTNTASTPKKLRPRSQSQKGFASPYYGKLGVESLPSEVKTLWYSRDQELPELPRHGWSHDLQTDMSQVEVRDLLFKILADAPLTFRENRCIELILYEEWTLREAAVALDCSVERVRQIYMKAMRKLRTHQKAVTKMEVWELEFRTEQWRTPLRIEELDKRRLEGRLR